MTLKFLYVWEFGDQPGIHFDPAETNTVPYKVDHSMLRRGLKDAVDFSHGEECGFWMVADFSGPLKAFRWWFTRRKES